MQHYYLKATTSAEVSGEELIRQMEQRFDNIVSVPVLLPREDKRAKWLRMGFYGKRPPCKYTVYGS